MADTLQTPPTASPTVEKLEAPPAAKRFAFLTDRWLAALFIAPALLLLLFLSIWPLIQLIGPFRPSQTNMLNALLVGSGQILPELEVIRGV